MRVAILGCIIALFCSGIYDVLMNVEDNGCEMTDVLEIDEYLKIGLRPEIHTKFPNYNLFLYRESEYAIESRSKDIKLRGVPVLFIPGQAGSYKQVRNWGTEELNLGRRLRHRFHFNFFALDLNEEMTGIFGAVLTGHTEFAHLCLRHILTMYDHLPQPKRPNTVLLVGHSMGGLIARALFVIPEFDAAHTVITQATPHRRPVIALDPYVADFYERVNSYWLHNGSRKHQDVLLVSTGGGYRDILVRDGLTLLDEISNGENTLSLSTMAVPNAWVSTDHRCHVWCRQIVMATVQSLFEIVDKNTRQVSADVTVRKKVFQHHFQKNPGVKQYQASFDLMIKVDEIGRWDAMKKRIWRFWLPSVNRSRYTAIEIPKLNNKRFNFVAISNVEFTKETRRIRQGDSEEDREVTPEWIGVCSLPEGATQCEEIVNFAHHGNLIPPQRSGLKAVHLDWDKLDVFTHAVVMTTKTVSPVVAVAELYEVSKRYVVHNVTSFVDFMWNFPNYLLSRQVIINATRPRAVFYNVSLRGLEIPLQAFSVHIDCIQCNASLTADGNENTIVKLHVPWSDQHTYTIIPRNTSGSLSAKLQSGRPEGQTSYPSIQFYIMPLCSYQISISISWVELFGQFVRYYAVFLPAYLVIQVLMVMSWQLMTLSKQGVVPSFSESHTRWAQPYRVGVVAMGIRLMLNYPPDNNLATILGLPLDDISTLQNENIWYQALPVMLHQVGYSFVGLVGYLIPIYFAVTGRIAGPLYRGFGSSASLARLTNVAQYLLLALAAVASGFLCGTIGIITAYLVFANKTISSVVTAKAISGGSGDGKLWNRFNFNLTLSLLCLTMLILNAPCLVAWINYLSTATPWLDLDPSRATGVVICLTSLMLAYVDMSLMFQSHCPMRQEEESVWFQGPPRSCPTPSQFSKKIPGQEMTRFITVASMEDFVQRNVWLSTLTISGSTTDSQFCDSGWVTYVMGAVSYVCCVLLVLFGTVSVYRLSHFINATLMTVALPSFLIEIRRTTETPATSDETDSGKAKTE